MMGLVINFCRLPWSRSWPSSQAQLNTVAQAALLFPATQEEKTLAVPLNFGHVLCCELLLWCRPWLRLDLLSLLD